MMRKPARRIRPCVERFDDRCLLSGLTAAQLTHAYGLDAITFASPTGQSVTGNGAGETIALVEAYNDPHVASDLHVFDQANGLPDPSLSVVNLAGSKTSGVWASEEMLDVEWAHAIAPAANILVVEARNDTLRSLIHAVDIARHTPGVATVSMSWGFNESAGETAFDSHFRTPAGHPGVTFIAASGDDGTAAGPEYPSTSPNVLAVGGTTLFVNQQGNYEGETAWSGSGGGFSRYEREPACQRSVQTSGRRSTPDVAFDADPDTGVEVYETPPGDSTGSWLIVGGTSLGTPAWAAIIAIADQGRALAGKTALDGATQTLPTLYRLPSSDFNGVSEALPFSPWFGGVGTFANTTSSTTGQRDAASTSGTARANIVTGLGSPVGPNLIAGLVASDITSTPPSTGVMAASTSGAAAGPSLHKVHWSSRRLGARQARGGASASTAIGEADRVS